MDTGIQNETGNVATEDDLTNALRQLHKNSHPERQEGEFTISEYAQANELTRSQAENELNYLFRMGKLIKPPKRYIDSAITTVYKVVDVS